jgi:AraC-like DNA-binding protein
MAQATGPFYLYRPGPPLSEFVDFFWTYEGYAPAHRAERLLPTATSELVFSVDGNGRDSCGISGVRSQSLVLDTSTPFSAIAVHFSPGGTVPFFDVPSTELRNSGVPLNVLWGRDAASASDRLWEERTSEKRFQALEELLLAKARERFDRHPAVQFALDAFTRSKGMRPVSDVTDRISLSPRRFGELFGAEVGLSPKTFCRVQRFNEVLTRIEQLTDVDWADLAASCGYFDQAHFNHDFRAFAGLTPSGYLQSRISRTHAVLDNTTR